MRISATILFLFCIGIWGTHPTIAQNNDFLDSSDDVAFQLDSGKTYIVEINKLLSTAESHLGTPYRYAGKTPGGFDCSGFVGYCYRSTLGIETPASSSLYVNYGIPINKDSARPGDVICFQGYKSRGTTPGHVGIITEITADDIIFIHSSSSHGIRFDSLSQDYYTQRYLFIRRVLSE